LTREFLADPRHHLAVAIEQGVVIGFASGVHYVHPEKAPQLWIDEISVVPEYRRQGVGKTPLRLLFDIVRTHGCTEAWVLTDRANPPPWRTTPRPAARKVPATKALAT
jgi:GNAT superfamily N-acetyltransferase